MKKVFLFMLFFLLSCLNFEKNILFYSSSKEFCEDFLKGLLLKVDEINKEGGISGYKIKIVDGRELAKNGKLEGKNFSAAIFGPLNNSDKQLFYEKIKGKIQIISLFPDDLEEVFHFYNDIYEESFFLGQSSAFFFNVNNILIVDGNQKIGDAFLKGYFNDESRKFERVSLKNFEENRKEFLKKNFQAIFFATDSKVDISSIREEFPLTILTFSTSQLSFRENVEEGVTTFPYYDTSKASGELKNFLLFFESIKGSKPNKISILGYEFGDFLKIFFEGKDFNSFSEINLLFTKRCKIEKKTFLRRFSLQVIKKDIYDDDRKTLKKIQEEVLRKRLYGKGSIHR